MMISLFNFTKTIVRHQLQFHDHQGPANATPQQTAKDEYYFIPKRVLFGFVESCFTWPHIKFNDVLGDGKRVLRLSLLSS
jgi:hypothetical protein